MPVARFFPVVSLVVALLAIQPCQAQEDCGANFTPTHRIESAQPLSAGTVRPALSLTGLQLATPSTVTVVLGGILLPAKADEATRATLFETLGGLEHASIMFTPSTESPDRHGRQHGTIQLEDGTNLVERLLAAGAGLADVSFAPCATRFLTAEAIARSEKRGIWRQSRIWTNLNAAATGLPDFVLGRGKVVSIGRSGRTTYINFGSNFRTDATVRIREAMRSELVAAGRPPESLNGQVVEVRGWATQRNGLDMELDSPQALRLPEQALGTGTD